MAILRALYAEQLKLKRTLALLLAPLMPLVIVVLQVAILWDGREYYAARDFADTWIFYGGQITFLWTVMMLPLFITLETALLANLEHANSQWKHLYALPIPRGAIYAAKQASSMAVIGLSTVALYIYIILSGWGLRVLLPGLGFEAPVPWLEFARYTAISYLASWLMISIHTWVGLRWKSFVVASATGVVATVVLVFLLQSEWGPWYPWSLPALVVNGLGAGEDVWNWVLVGSLGGIGAALVGGWDVVRRDVL